MANTNALKKKKLNPKKPFKLHSDGIISIYIRMLFYKWAMDIFMCEATSVFDNIHLDVSEETWKGK